MFIIIFYYFKGAAAQARAGVAQGRRPPLPRWPRRQTGARWQPEGDILAPSGGRITAPAAPRFRPGPGPARAGPAPPAPRFRPRSGSADLAPARPGRLRPCRPRRGRPRSGPGPTRPGHGRRQVDKEVERRMRDNELRERELALYRREDELRAKALIEV